MQSWRGKTNTGWLSCTSRAVLKLYLFIFFNVWIVNKLRLVSFELGPRENLDIDINCFVDTSVRCHAVMKDRIWMHLAGEWNWTYTASQVFLPFILAAAAGASVELPRVPVLLQPPEEGGGDIWQDTLTTDSCCALQLLCWEKGATITTPWC